MPREACPGSSQQSTVPPKWDYRIGEGYKWRGKCPTCGRTYVTYRNGAMYRHGRSRYAEEQQEARRGTT